MADTMIVGFLPESDFYKYRAAAAPVTGDDSVAIPSADKAWLVAMLTRIYGAEALQKTDGGGLRGIVWMRKKFVTARSAALDFLDTEWTTADMSGGDVRKRLVKSGHSVDGLDDDGDARTALEAVRLEALRAQNYDGVDGLVDAAQVAALRERGCPASAENAAELLTAVSQVTRHALITKAFGDEPWATVVGVVLGLETAPLTEAAQAADVVARLLAVPAALRGDWDDPSAAQTVLIVQHLVAHPLIAGTATSAIDRLLLGSSGSDTAHALSLAGLRAVGSIAEQRAVLDAALACLSAAAKARLFAISPWQVRCVALASVAAAAGAGSSPLITDLVPQRHIVVDSFAQELLKKSGASDEALALPANADLTLDAIRGLILSPASAVDELQTHHGLTRVQAWRLVGAAQAEISLAGGGAAASAAAGGNVVLAPVVEPGAHALAKASASGAVDVALRQFACESSLPDGEFLLLFARTCVVTVGLRALLSAAQAGASTRAVDLRRRLEKAMVRLMEQARSAGDLGASHVPVTAKLAAALRKEELYSFVQGGGLKSMLKAARPGTSPLRFVWPVDIGQAALVVRLIGVAFVPYFGGSAVSGWETFSTWYQDLCFVVKDDEQSHALLVDIVQDLFHSFQERCAGANGDESAYAPPALDFVAVAPRVEFLRNQVRLNAVVAQSLSGAKAPVAPPAVSVVVMDRFFSATPWTKGGNGDKFSKLSVPLRSQYKQVWLDHYQNKCFNKIIYGSCAATRCTRSAFH
jgi:hypothetical protein